VGPNARRTLQMPSRTSSFPLFIFINFLSYDHSYSALHSSLLILRFINMRSRMHCCRQKML
jgi:hypothetical protein